MKRYRYPTGAREEIETEKGKKNIKPMKGERWFVVAVKTC